MAANCPLSCKRRTKGEKMKIFEEVFFDKNETRR
jgi:hypothetical protein